MVLVTQFRQENEHSTQIWAVHRFLKVSGQKEKVQLVLVGRSRSEAAERWVANLKRLVEDFGIEVSRNVGIVYRSMTSQRRRAISTWC